jgi:hypothetical protein
MWQFFLDNYPDAKGSSHNHQNWKGGYFDHIKNTMEYATILYAQLKPPIDLSDAILVLFLHDIEKPIKYSQSEYPWFFSTMPRNDNDIRAELIKHFNIQLNNDQKLALKYIHGEGDDYKKDERVMSPLAAFCHCCDVISARIFYNK